MIHFKIATPERVMIDQEVDSLTLPTQIGEITILPNHVPLIANLIPGEIRFKTGIDEKFFAVSSGVIEVKKNNEVVVLAETAEFGHEIDLNRAEEARQRAKNLMTESYKDEKAQVNASAILEKQLARIKIARKHRTHTHKNLESSTLE